MTSSRPNTQASLKRRVEEALAKRLFRQDLPPPQWPKRPSYTLRAEDILVSGVDLEEIRPDLTRGGGSELNARKGQPPKFHAAHSSSALAVNTLGPYRKNPTALVFAGRSRFTLLEFEYPCPTGAGRGTANLDVLLKGDGVILGVESKLTESLSRKRARFSKKYERVVNEVADKSWRAVYEALVSKPNLYEHLDAAQLIKHYLGLRRRFRVGRVALVYLFWEPLNATAFEVYQKHAGEVAGLERRLRGSEIPLLSLRYSELWQELSQGNPAHVTRLRERYAFPI